MSTQAERSLSVSFNPRSCVRSDGYWKECEPKGKQFQSTLLREERPGVADLGGCLQRFQSTLLREERPDGLEAGRAAAMFQSTLLREERQWT